MNIDCRQSVEVPSIGVPGGRRLAAWFEKGDLPQGASHFHHASRSIGGPLGEQVPQEPINLRRNRLIGAGGGRRRGMKLLFEELLLGRGGERGATGQQFVEQTAEGVDIGSLINTASADLLRRHVTG